MNDIERLTVAQAVFKAVAEQVSTKNPDGLRGLADADLLGMYDRMGVKSIDLKLNGEKVGTYSVTMSKSTPERHERKVLVRDEGAVKAWAKDNPDEFDEWLAGSWEAFAEYCFEEYGEVPDGCEVVDHVTPAQPERPKGTTLKVDVPKVADALRGLPPETVVGLLDGEA